MPEPRRYDTMFKLASGGMATVFVGAARGALGFRQLVAIKRPHPHILFEEHARDEIIAEARLASMIHHANVVDVRDVEVDGETISLVMDYVEGASLSDMVVAAAATSRTLPPRVVVRIMLDALAGLHAAHELCDERGRPVGLVHRDISPQNILVGIDGVARVTDFGVAKFRKNETSHALALKGKLAYMAPEVLRGERIDRRFDVFAAGVVLWEALAARRLFRADSEAETLRRVLEQRAPQLDGLEALQDVLDAALAKTADTRFQSAEAMAHALETAAGRAGLVGTHGEVTAELKSLVGSAIDARRQQVRAKLANEPTIASLMGGVVAVPDTVPDGPGSKTLRDSVAPFGQPPSATGLAVAVTVTAAIPPFLAPPPTDHAPRRAKTLPGWTTALAVAALVVVVAAGALAIGRRVLQRGAMDNGATAAAAASAEPVRAGATGAAATNAAATSAAAATNAAATGAAATSVVSELPSATPSTNVPMPARTTTTSAAESGERTVAAARTEKKHPAASAGRAAPRLAPTAPFVPAASAAPGSAPVKKMPPNPYPDEP